MSHGFTEDESEAPYFAKGLSPKALSDQEGSLRELSNAVLNSLLRLRKREGATASALIQLSRLRPTAGLWIPQLRDEHEATELRSKLEDIAASLGGEGGGIAYSEIVPCALALLKGI